jgi:glycosyltransferase involved in cell wall biosynthesis
VRILLANKFFFPGAGSETVFFQTRSLLQERGHEVIDFATQDERNLPSPYARFFAPHRGYDRPGPRDVAASVYSLTARRALRRLIDHAGAPDLAHLHNVYHQLSLSIFDELRAQRIPVVLTVHDSKPVCPSYSIFTEGAPCRRCVDGSVINAIRHRCIRGSRPASAIAAVEGAVSRARRTYERVDMLVTPSRFMAGVLERGGIRTGITVVPNFFETAERHPGDGPEGPYFLFIGRLDERKGVPVLLDAFRRYGGRARLRMIGSGPLESEIRGLGSESGVELLGIRDEEEILEELAGAEALVVPSTSEENCPMTVLEARSQRTPVICSDRGGLPELVSDRTDGLLFAAGSSQELADRMRLVADRPSLARELADRGLQRLLADHSKERYHDGLMEAYAAAQSRAAGQGAERTAASTPSNLGQGGSTPTRARSRSTSGR